MRLTVLGATGGTGLEVLKQGVAAGHDVTALVRNADKVPAELRDRMTVTQADLMDAAAIAPAIKDADAVLSAMGVRSLKKGITACSDSIHAVIEAAQGAPLRRVLMVSAAGMHIDDADDVMTRYLFKPLLQQILKNPYVDLSEAERNLRASTLDWTIVCPSRLTDKPATGNYRTSLDRNIPGGRMTTRADTAACMLALITDQSSIHHTVFVAS